MPFSRLAENRIRDAIADGGFDNLSVAGQPLDLDGYFSAPPELRMAYSILKNARCVPLEVELLNEVARLAEAVSAAPDPEERDALQRRLAERRMQLAVMLERRRRGEK